MVQDLLWLDDTVESILRTRLRVYFVPKMLNNDMFFVIVKGAVQVRDNYLSAWRRLIRDELFSLCLFDTDD
jgi:hypothetical protein